MSPRLEEIEHSCQILTYSLRTSQSIPILVRAVDSLLGKGEFWKQGFYSTTYPLIDDLPWRSSPWLGSHWKQDTSAHCSEWVGHRPTNHTLCLVTNCCPRAPMARVCIITEEQLCSQRSPRPSQAPQTSDCHLGSSCGRQEGTVISATFHSLFCRFCPGRLYLQKVKSIEIIPREFYLIIHLI